MSSRDSSSSSTDVVLDFLDHPEVENNLPSYTLDVNQIALKDPEQRDERFNGLVELEWNYFKNPREVELCVTPVAEEEITRGEPSSGWGPYTYRRLQKSRLFKRRSSTSLDLTEDEQDRLWTESRNILFPNVSDEAMVPRQVSDVSQLFNHAVVGSTLSNTAFVTEDLNFVEKRCEIRRRLGVEVRRTGEAWEEARDEYGLRAPPPEQAETLIQQQDRLLDQLLSDRQKA